MKRKIFVVLLVLIMVVGSGCGNDDANLKTDGLNDKQQSTKEEQNFYTESQKVAECYRDIYEQAIDDDSIGNVETIKNIVKRIGANGYIVVDAGNQIDMINREQLMNFIGKVADGLEAEATLICVMENGDYTRFDFQSSGGSVQITRSYLAWNGKNPEVKSKEEYTAYTWEYSEDGYLFFEQYRMSGYDGPSGHTAVRIQPLDEKCREVNRKYLLPMSYGLNNMFVVDWNEEDFGELDFYDIYDKFYFEMYNAPSPYLTDENLGVGAVYHISKKEFEKVIKLHFKIDSKTLQSKLKYYEEDQSYEYRPRGFYEWEPPSYPFPEVVEYVENRDGTITLTVHAVYPDHNSSKAYEHLVVIRPLAEGGFQYVSNSILSPDDKDVGTWRVPRLTEEEWNEVYGEGE